MKKALQGIFGLVRSVVLLDWVFHDKDPQALSGALLDDVVKACRE